MRVISPVMANPGRRGRPPTAESRAAVRVMPAEGPSLGMAPSGTWTWMSRPRSKSGAMPSAPVLALRKERAAWALSFITSPRLPVRISFPSPDSTAASTGSRVPPVSVQASP